MPNLNALTRVAFKVLPTCSYVVTGPDPTTVKTLAEQLDTRGYLIDDADHVYPTTGLLTGITKDNIQLLPEGMNAEGGMVYTTESNFGLPGNCNNRTLQRFTLTDKDGMKYMLMSRRRKGCLWQYACELQCGPDC